MSLETACTHQHTRSEFLDSPKAIPDVWNPRRKTYNRYSLVGCPRLMHISHTLVRTTGFCVLRMLLSHPGDGRVAVCTRPPSL